MQVRLNVPALEKIIPTCLILRIKSLHMLHCQDRKKPLRLLTVHNSDNRAGRKTARYGKPFSRKKE
ncbi:hypothetical protein CHL67_10130 [Prosthecochloris sp. GSB1]|nr:hypothetical protein CHL67_10130 [Prosthecochloris sp. GSB1]